MESNERRHEEDNHRHEEDMAIIRKLQESLDENRAFMKELQKELDKYRNRMGSFRMTKTSEIVSQLNEF